ncbi:MAG: radical SAM protein [Alphaproteobacteria bacterium]|nr:radical SAM protein [Alphaproteobacteria bacterium]
MRRKDTFHFVAIKPTHYDDDGYPITWVRSIVPSNSLAVLYGLAADGANRQILGPTVDFELKAYDETNCRVRPDRIISDIKASGGKCLICFVGVQSNQFPHAVELARPFLTAGLPVILGGFHVAGCMSMLDALPSEIQDAMDMGISMFAGEAEEHRLDQVITDAWNGELKPVYNFLSDLPALDGEPPPYLPPAELDRTLHQRSSFDLGRGCPYQCSFCTIINVQGRKSRFRTPDDLERIVRENAAQGIRKFFITDDNLARNKDWEAFFDRLISLRESENLRVSLIIQVDTQCHMIPNFIEKARKAGCRRVFLGLENINPDNLIGAKKHQNKITDYRLMLQKWRDVGAYTWAGYITGFPADSKASILRDIEIIKEELPLDMLELFMLTPLPGSEDHRNMVRQGAWMDPDLNKYDNYHRVSHHGKMPDDEWEEAYHQAWSNYYTWDHIETVARRHAATGGNPKRLAMMMTEFKAMYMIEGLHPLEGGVIRLKYRADRRPGFPREPIGIFHAKLLAECITKTAKYAYFTYKCTTIGRKVARDHKRSSYMDTAIMPVAQQELAELSIFAETAGGLAAVERKLESDRLRKKFITGAKAKLQPGRMSANPSINVQIANDN